MAEQLAAAREFFVEVFSPRYSHLYAAALNRPCLLIETHTLKDAKTRAWANYDIMVHCDRYRHRGSAKTPHGNSRGRRQVRGNGRRSQRAAHLPRRQDERSLRHPFVYHSLKTAAFQSEITGTAVVRYTAEKDDFATLEP